MQLEHSQFTSLSPSSEIILLCDHIVSPANIGAIFRLADAFGVQEIIFGGNFPDLKSSRLRKTARHTVDTVRFRESNHLVQTLQELHTDNYTSIALEITSQSKPIKELQHNSKMVLIIGNEKNGIDKELLELANFQAHIDMYGLNSSMNVAQATAIALYELRRA